MTYRNTSYWVIWYDFNSLCSCWENICSTFFMAISITNLLWFYLPCCLDISRGLECVILLMYLRIVFWCKYSLWNIIVQYRKYGGLLKCIQPKHDHNALLNFIFCDMSLDAYSYIEWTTLYAIRHRTPVPTFCLD